MNWSKFIDCFPSYHRPDVEALLQIVSLHHNPYGDPNTYKDVPDYCECPACKALKTFANLSACHFQDKINNHKFGTVKPEEWLRASENSIREWVANRTVLRTDRLYTFSFGIFVSQIGGQFCLFLLPQIPMGQFDFDGFGQFDFDGFVFGFETDAERENFRQQLRNQLTSYGYTITKDEEYCLPKVR